MRYFLLIILLLSSISTVSAAVLSSDDFNRGDSTDLGPLWYETFAENAIDNNKLNLTDNAQHGVIHQYETTSYPINISMKLYNVTVATDHRARIYTNTSGNETVDGPYLRFCCGYAYTKLVVDGSYLAPNTTDGGIGEHAWIDGETIVLRLESNRVEVYIGGDYIGFWEESLGYGWIAIITDTANFQWSIDDYSIDSDAPNSAPNIDSYAPSTPNSTYENVATTYNATINQSNSNNEWLINGTNKEWDNATGSPTYTNSTWVSGVYNLTLISHNSTNHSLTDSQMWLVTVQLNSVDVNVTYWNPGSGSLVATYNVINITAGVSTINILLNVTRDTWKYTLTYSNKTEISNQTATSTNESLNFSIPLVEDSYSITEFSTSPWTYYKIITLNQTMINSTIGNVHYTLLVDLTSDSDLADHAQVDGDDIIFTNSANTTQLDHQISSFNSSTGALVAYVGITDPSNVTSINMYYNNSEATNTEDKAGTWGVNASGVWLMDEGVGSYVNDSSGNDNNGTIISAGWATDGLYFNGVSDYINIANTDLILPIDSSYTACTWVKMPNIVDSERRIFFESGNDYVISLGWGNDNPGSPFGRVNQFQAYTRISGSGRWVNSITNPSADTWYFICTVVDADTNQIFLYVDGQSEIGVDSSNTFTNVVDDSAGLRIGSYRNVNGRWMQGNISNVKVYNCAFSSDEISTLYNNTKYPTLFISLGAEQPDAADTTDPTFSNSAITPIAIRENDPFTVRVDVNDSDGIITTAIVTISGNNYTMTNIGGDTWSYTFTATSLPTRYYVQNFYAQDNDSAWNSTTSTLYIDAVSSTGTGSSGGITPVTTPTPTPTPGPTAIPIPFTDTNITEILENAEQSVKAILGLYEDGNYISIFKINTDAGEKIYTKEIYIENPSNCTIVDNASAINKCVPGTDMVTISMPFVPENEGLFYSTRDYVEISTDSEMYYVNVDILVINLYAIFSTETLLFLLIIVGAVILFRNKNGRNGNG